LDVAEDQVRKGDFDFRVDSYFLLRFWVLEADEEVLEEKEEALEVNEEVEEEVKEEALEVNEEAEEEAKQEAKDDKG
jgi:hypothetical protein